MITSGQDNLVFSYSVYPWVYLSAIFLLLYVSIGVYFGFILSNPIPLLIFLGLWSSSFYWLWTKPLRSVRFYENHLEVTGWKVKLRADYTEVEDLSRVTRRVGDFKSNGTLWFSIEDDTNEFTLPNRIFGNPKRELYSWLLQKNPRLVNKLG